MLEGAAGPSSNLDESGMFSVQVSTPQPSQSRCHVQGSHQHAVTRFLFDRCALCMIARAAAVPASICLGVNMPTGPHSRDQKHSSKKHMPALAQHTP
jgi:hypothetical protein